MLQKNCCLLWLFEKFVAVNPYLGFADKKFSGCSTRIGRQREGNSDDLATEFYLQKISEGRITAADLTAVLHKQKQTRHAQEFIKKLWKMSNQP